MSGDIIDVRFNLHDETVNSVHVNNLITALLKSIDNEISFMGEVSNGDVLQAITMVLAIRAHIIHAPVETTSVLAKTLLNANRLGLSLAQVENIGGSLLDFESSISAEMEAELLTGQQLNLEKARTFALNNDIAGLTQEIAKQVNPTEK